ncbi:MAG TPA: undecaprenyl-phosphate glucose phosphotransferase [Thermoanaerobaculales bacterium]|nr:undecaprenyl-phosphate glucose phosphotransferase [Thermoanaerobaculales bacterium]HPA79295.1 undecaprenyl-phosphate glucose phosphotransferase [Thermoanaerobaculales bacterium]HQL29746.1 undecaprenyl-phosphate glucose phosphotransferase [Thermoanaerobaculales bacterium]HQN96909.1 undecaprenyl-phosphate glucose phosphotransferase [Thermoanaerobaculales bacterium]HQP42714.1 undecaprenyl-phosphate glucose phosphotransferase [Thermoanaerobaculales bacterium]
MIQRRRQIEALIKLAGDVVATAAAVMVAYWLRFEVQVQPVTKGLPPIEPYLRLLPAVVVLWPVVFYFQGLYHRRRMLSRADEAVRVALAVLLATVLLTAGLTFYRDFSYSRLFLAMFAAVDAVLVTGTRLAIRAALGRIRRSGGNLQQVLVAGAGDLGREVVERLREHRELGFKVVGFLDDDPGKQQRKIHGVQVLGTIQDLEAVVAQHAVDQLLIALPLSAHQRTVQLIRQAGQLLLEVKVVPDLLQYYVLRAGVEDLDGLPVINLSQIPLDGWNQIVKRTFDITVAVLALLLTGWMFPIIAWLIKREDGGPVLFTQVRTGMDGRSFRLYKFRSMRVDASANGQAQWTRARDPRITRIGAVLRRFNLDELPQLLNVVVGDMSLVGPRPEQPEYVERFRARYPEYNTRHLVRSGITGWAQVNGLRGDTSIRQRMVHDLYYIQNWSFALDLRILWRTLRLAVGDARG